MRNRIRTKEDEAKFALRKARQAHQEVEGKAAMAEYRKSADDAVSRMARLRAERLKREAKQK
jgi:hypothetical protein